MKNRKLLFCSWTTARSLVALAILALQHPSIAQQADLPYISGSTGADGPLAIHEIPLSGRYGHAMAYDPSRQQVILFGGLNGNYLDDTWVWNGTNWSRVFPATSPSPRYGHRMVYDGARQELLLVGGNQSGEFCDTWGWNGSNWVQKPLVNAPVTRRHHGLAYDAVRQRVVLFGGYTQNNTPLGGTWLWDGTNWALASPSSSPSARANLGMVFDAARQRVVLFGGTAGSYGSSETWQWDGITWTQAAPANSPSGRYGNTMSYDPIRQEVMLFGGFLYCCQSLQDTWAWNGTNWIGRSPSVQPSARNEQAVAYDESRQKAVLFGGSAVSDGYDSETWLWDGASWEYWSGKTQIFDMTSRPSGTWNFTTIRIPPGVTLKFKKAAGNAPIRWLATGQVTIDGTLDLSGETAATGGPGGFDGGRRGIRFDSSGSYAGSPGQGPGGGLPGVSNSQHGQDANYAGSYGNIYIQPLVGGSGGGGGGSGDSANGGAGGGGGGAILIASSRDIAINGKIMANGAPGDYGGVSYGGVGSGGAILLRADRITGTGSLEASGYGPPTYQPRPGRIRLEAYYRLLSGPSTPIAVNSAPVSNQDFNAVGALNITGVAGQNVIQPPSGNALTPDVTFTEAGPVTVTVTAQNIPDGTPVRLRITTSGSVINKPEQGDANVILTGGSATFSVLVPKGTGTIQAFAEFTLNNQ